MRLKRSFYAHAYSVLFLKNRLFFERKDRKKKGEKNRGET